MVRTNETETRTTGQYRWGNDVVYGVEALALERIVTAARPLQARDFAKYIFGEYTPETSQRLSSTISELNLSVTVSHGKITTCEYPAGGKANAGRRTYALKDVTDEQRAGINAVLAKKIKEVEDSEYELTEGVVTRGRIALAARMLDQTSTSGFYIKDDFRAFLYPYTRDIEVDKWVAADIKKAAALIREHHGIEVVSRGGKYYRNIELASPSDEGPISLVVEPDATVRSAELRLDRLTPTQRGILAAQVLHLLQDKNIDDKNLDNIMFEQVHLWFVDNMKYLPMILKDFEDSKAAVIGQKVAYAAAALPGETRFMENMRRFLDENPDFWTSEYGVLLSSDIQELFTRWDKQGRTFRTEGYQSEEEVVNTKEQIRVAEEEDPRIRRKLKFYLRALRGKGFDKPTTADKIDTFFRRFNMGQQRWLTNTFTMQGHLSPEIQEYGGQLLYNLNDILFVYYLSEHRKYVEKIVQSSAGIHEIIKGVLESDGLGTTPGR